MATHLLRRLLRDLSFVALLALIGSASVFAQDAKPAPALPPFPDDPLALVAEGNKAKAQGRYDDASAYYQRAIRLDPRSFEAHLGLGMTLDLKGQYADAETELNRALGYAPENARQDRDSALSALAVSYAFRGDIDGAQRYYEKLYDFQIATARLDNAASTAQTIGRAYLDAGDTRTASQWFQTGQDAVHKMSGLAGDQIDLWQMRWEHAQSRIAARSGNPEEAETHLANMKRLVDKGGLNAAQQPNYQYLVGYNAFYAGDYDAAIAALQHADPRDPTIMTMIAEAYAKKGDPAAAKTYVDKVAVLPLHTLQGALARSNVKKVEAEIEKLKAEQEKNPDSKPEPRDSQTIDKAKDEAEKTPAEKPTVAKVKKP
jgi:tetratricopeptide (TPR) repeat protein